MLFEVKNIALAVPYKKAFDYLSDNSKLPEWTNAFAEVKDNGEALMRTGAGEVPVKLENILDPRTGIIDTIMTFPNGDVGKAHSRLIPLDDQSCAYSFILTPPPVALEELEGALAEQSGILEKELVKLKTILEG
ncbi:MAG: hypothetical protein ACRBBN_04020 [Methyloligellaceae bacterium]